MDQLTDGFQRKIARVLREAGWYVENERPLYMVIGAINLAGFTLLCTQSITSVDKIALQITNGHGLVVWHVPHCSDDDMSQTIREFHQRAIIDGEHMETMEVIY